ncbi:MAG: phosphatase PAP2 family protein [Actinobacteria bacterium]|nr:phosphatase PAP2 family protein [Actinomycetota bacterium]
MTGETRESDVADVGRRRWRDLPDEATARRRLRWWRELLLVLVLYEVYTLVRNTFGSSGNSIKSVVSDKAVAVALGHAHDVIGLEKRLGLFFEPHLQHWYLGLPAHGFIKFWNIYYGSFHFLVPIAILIWLFRRFPQDYAVWRNALVMTTLLALVGFAAFSLMPPRLLDFHGEFGGCSLPAHYVLANPRLACRQFGLVDTLATYGGLWSFGNTAMAHVSNQFAAMPSLHIGWSTWCAVVVAPRARRRWVKVLVIAYPFATLTCILVTANHYWLDAAGGVLTVAVGSLLGWQLALVVHNWADRRVTRGELETAA